MLNFGVVFFFNFVDFIFKYGVFWILVKIILVVLLFVDLNVDYGDMGMMIIKEYFVGIFLSCCYFVFIII